MTDHDDRCPLARMLTDRALIDRVTARAEREAAEDPAVATLLDGIATARTVALEGALLHLIAANAVAAFYGELCDVLDLEELVNGPPGAPGT